MDTKTSVDEALELWRRLSKAPEVVKFFTGTFEVMGILVPDTGETLTVRMNGRRIDVERGLSDTRDYLVPIPKKNLMKMIDFAEDGRIDKLESWRIATGIFIPLLREALQNPVMCNPILRRLAGVEDVIHIHLIGPKSRYVASHTAVFVNGEWLVSEGTHGYPKRTLALTGEECANFQRQIFKAKRAGSLLGWFRFSRWYLKWRPSAELRV